MIYEYGLTKPTKFCPKCNAYHSLHYSVDQYSKRHLYVDCPKGQYSIRFVPKLDIPVVRSRAKSKLDAEARQVKLL